MVKYVWPTGGSLTTVNQSRTRGQTGDQGENECLMIQNVMYNILYHILTFIFTFMLFYTAYKYMVLCDAKL